VAPKQDLIISRHSYDSSSIEREVKCIKKMHTFFKKKGIKNVGFIYFPSQQRLLNKKNDLNLDFYTENFIHLVSKELGILNIPTVDSANCMDLNARELELTLTHDTHLSKYGIKVLSACITDSTLSTIFH
jgi:hypothetical protein